MRNPVLRHVEEDQVGGVELGDPAKLGDLGQAHQANILVIRANILVIRANLVVIRGNLVVIPSLSRDLLFLNLPTDRLPIPARGMKELNRESPPFVKLRMAKARNGLGEH